MNKNINLNLLKYFYEVVNNKTILNASKKLFISQPALTKSIKNLENELNVKLLKRSKNGVEPTIEGEILYKNIQVLFQNLDKTLNIIDNNKETNQVLHIGATTTNFLDYIMPILNKLKEKYPSIHINIILEEMNILLDQYKLGKMDIIIKNDYERINDFLNIKSFEIVDKFVASKNHFPELENKIMNLEDLLKYPFVLLSNITHGRRNFNDYLASKNINFKPTYEFNSYSLCRELIKNGFGIGVGNPIHYQNDSYIIVNTDFDLPHRTFNIGYMRNSQNELIKEFIKLIKEEK